MVLHVCLQHRSGDFWHLRPDPLRNATTQGPENLTSTALFALWSPPFPRAFLLIYFNEGDLVETALATSSSLRLSDDFK